MTTMTTMTMMRTLAASMRPRWPSLHHRTIATLNHLRTPRGGTILDLFLTQHTIPKNKLRKCDARPLWHMVFDADWEGPLENLPEINRIKNEDLCKVRTREMYNRLVAQFPEYSNENPRLATIDGFFNAYFTPEPVPDYYRIQNIRKGEKGIPFKLRNIPLYHGWLDSIKMDHPITLAYECIENGYNTVLEHLFKTKAVDASKICMMPVSSLEMMDNAMDVATRNKNFETLKILHDYGCNAITTASMDFLAKKGCLRIMTWLHENRTEGCTTRAMDVAAARGRLDAVKWLHENRAEGCTTDAMDGAAANGRLEVVKWLHENRTEGCTNKATELAAKNNHLNILEWFDKHIPSRISSKTLFWAAKKSHQKTFDWLLDRFPQFIDINVIQSASNKQMVRQLISNLSTERRTDLLAEATAKSLITAVRRLKDFSNF